jgi:hypothetical protein
MMMESEATVQTAGSKAGGNNINTGECGKDNAITILDNNIKIGFLVKTTESEDNSGYLKQNFDLRSSLSIGVVLKV